ncbi:MAG: acetylglutamate kinase [Lachnospiraceae bacterium]|nr:acetylglutamate kinase [Lachnospiraceae bacterium]
MNKITDKAETLIEALPYIRDFNNKIVVVKYGGSAMIDKDLEESVIKDVVLLKLVGMKPVIVHGGGKEISKWLSNFGKETQFIDGLRVTDAETVEIAEMVLNKVNKNLVQMIEGLGIKAVGVSGKDAGLAVAQKKTPNGNDIGYVGDIKSVNPELIMKLIEDDYIPVIAPIGMGENGETFNINADDMASAVAVGLNAEKLAFLTDIDGVLRDPSDPSTLISVLTLKAAEELINNGSISGGMIPKINNCTDAVKKGVGRVHILDGRREHCLLLEFFTKRGIGTAIIDAERKLYAHEIG